MDCVKEKKSRMGIRVSIIVPAYNAGKNLVECLSALIASSDVDSEIIVVDDGSTDNTPFLAAKMGARVLRLEKNSGVSAARNYGARHARGAILFFVDADVVVAQGAIDRVKKMLKEQPDLAAVFGSYDAKPKAPGVISQYRNLLHHFVHQNGVSEASTFWAGCGAIRRAVFETIGGFDEKRFPYPSIEDIELGYRLRQRGYRVLLDKALQGTHLKRWNLLSVIRTDTFCRAIPWSRLILESKRAPDDLNLKWGQRISGALVALGCIFLALAVLRPELLALSAVSFLGVVFLNRALYTFFYRQRGVLFAGACIPLHLLYYLCSGISFLYVWAEVQLKKLAPARAVPVPKTDEQDLSSEKLSREPTHRRP
jgi:glycosyltransferase involved in cell wall biosynthesis